jgi:dienelactone hydrolase
MKLSTTLAFIMTMTPWIAQAALKTEIVEYKEGDTVLEGYLAYDGSLTGKRPGVLVVHEWNGLGDYVKQRTDQLARLGYVAFAADIYGKAVRPKTPQESGAEAGKYKANRTLLRSRAKAGLEALKSNPNVDPARIAAIGYCFGGTTVLELARSGADVAGVVSFHGGLDTPAPGDAKNIRCKVLVLNGADDPHAPAEQVAAFQDEMRNAGVDWQVISFGGAVHGFTNPANGNDNSKGVAYNAKADQRSWEAMKTFFAEIFAQNR